MTDLPKTCDTLIIDGPYLSHRSQDAPYTLQRSDGLKVTQVHSFLRTMLSLSKKLLPKKVYVTWESHGTPSWRRTLYKDYKPSVKIPDEVIEMREDIKRILYKTDAIQYYAPGNEADDVIATLVEKEPEENTTFIFTVDKDIMQLISNNTYLHNGKAVVGEEEVVSHYGVSPRKLKHLLAITGDSSDNIPGVPGYGPKKSSQILNECHDTHQITEIYPSFLKYKKQLELNLKLITLNSSAPLREIEFENSYSIEGLLDKYELPKLKSSISQIKRLTKHPTSLNEFFEETT